MTALTCRGAGAIGRCTGADGGASTTGFGGWVRADGSRGGGGGLDGDKRFSLIVPGLSVTDDVTAMEAGGVFSEGDNA